MYTKKMFAFTCFAVLTVLTGCNNKENLILSTETFEYSVGDSYRKEITTEGYVNISNTLTDNSTEQSDEQATSDEITVNDEENIFISDSPPVDYTDTTDTSPVYNTDNNYQSSEEYVDNVVSDENSSDVASSVIDNVTESESNNTESGSYIINRYGSFENYGLAIIDGINEIRAGYGYAPLVVHPYASEVAYRVNCEQTGEKTGHWKASQRPSLTGYYRELESIGLAPNASYSRYADAKDVAYALTLGHTKGIVTHADQAYIGISILPSEFYNNYIVITIDTYSEGFLSSIQ